jgi:hypothetical protein
MPSVPSSRLRAAFTRIEREIAWLVAAELTA